MTDRPAKPSPAAISRQERLAKALRINLLRRKAQARAKQDAAAGTRQDKPAKS
jgi:hypothetical protein